MRKLRLPLVLHVFGKEDAERKCKQILSSKQTLAESKLISNRINVKPQFEMTKSILPPPEQMTMKIFISHVNNCGSFYARQLNPEKSNLLRFIEMSINSEKGKNLQVLIGLPEINMLYLAPYGGQGAKEYYRALVQEILPKNKVKVFFVDYGNTEEINMMELRCIDSVETPDILSTPPLAIECALAEIKPFRSPSGEWSDKANIWFKEAVNGIPVDAVIYSTIQDKLRVIIKKKNHQGLITDINQEMVKKNFAEPAEENLLSKQNHEIRMKAASYKNADPIVENITNDIQVSWKEVTEFKDLEKKGVNVVRLHGPYNPLEVSYTGMTNVDRNKCFNVDRDSVNSVSFNAEPQDPYSAMLVAAHIGVGQSTLDLIGRNTTLMPKIQGLPTLICLLFTPTVEFRTDKERKSYTGAICGLGYDNLTGDSIYPDHDIEITFDIQMSLKDIREINAIRMGFNLLLDTQSDILQYETVQFRRVHEKTRETIFNLLQRRRKPKEPTPCKIPYRWNQIPIDLLLMTGVDQRADHPDIFPLHRPPCLNSVPNQDKLDHLEKLYKLAEETWGNELKVIRCELCSLDVTSARDLLIHLDSERHQQKERLLREQ